MSYLFRVARPTDRLEEVTQFYQRGLGLQVAGSFENQIGFDGIIFEHPILPCQLEFTHCHNYSAGNAPTPENLTVFFLASYAEWQSALNRLERLGHERVVPYNPFWESNAAMFADPDGYRVVLYHGQPG